MFPKFSITCKRNPILGGERGVGDQVLWGVPIFKENKKKKTKNTMIYKDNNGLHIKYHRW
jgi:hypothetical protein